MISPVEELDGAPVLQGAFTLDDGDVTSAVLRVSSLGIFEASLNGAPVSDDVLSPGWSAYEWRIRYRDYDVATQLVPGANVIDIQLGNGWYRGRLGWTGKSAFYGDRLGAIAELTVTFADGQTQTITTDDTWRARRSDTTVNDLYDGQSIDARRRDEEPTWIATEVIPFDASLLTPYVGPPVRRFETRRPQRIWLSPGGKTLIDFGQNLVGWIRLRAVGNAGDVVTVRHAEVLEHDELGSRPLRTAKATDHFTLSGGHDEFEPTLTFHGFRYVEVTGYPGEVTEYAIEAVVVHSDMARIGTFECSNDMLNQLHSNVVWGLRGNFLDVPTDCPQRDERLGWTGDLAVFAPAAAFLYDTQSFLQDWLHDLAAEQTAADGRIPFVVPDILKFDEKRLDMMKQTTAIWGDATVWVPWAMWQAYGDEAILRDNYASMAWHIRHVASLLDDEGLWTEGFQFGDWLDPDSPPSEPWRAKADRHVVASACFFRSASMVASAASQLGHADDAAEFAALAARTRAAFNEFYVSAHKGTIRSDAVTVYALAIVFGLLDDEVRAKAGDRLAELVAENGHRIATGFAGTPYVTDALTMTGHVDDAYKLLLQTECPSWLYSVSMGATTIWERWDSMLPDGSINEGEMTSFNHYALGGVADWMHRTIGGIAPLTPGYERVLVAPRPGGDIGWAKTSLATRHGEVRVEWQTGPDATQLTVDLPAGVTGRLDTGDGPSAELASGRTVTSF